MARQSVYLVLLCLFATSAASSAEPWDEAFSSSSPAAILKAASAVPVSDKAEVIVLLEDHHYEIQPDGRTTITVRRLYRICKQSAVEDWSVVEQPWEPWHEKRPELRARVISPDASIHWLDASTIADAPSAQFDATIFSDSRVIRAPLPAVAEASVIEYQVVLHETAPLFGAGVTRELTVGSGVPMERFHVTVDAAQGATLRIASSLIPASAITRSDIKGTAHVEVELAHQEPPEHVDFFVPPDVPLYPSFRFSTGSSWQSVAALYRKIVAERINTPESNSLVSALGISTRPSTEPPREIARKWTSELHERVRYTGVEFGEAAIVPNKPMDVLNRHYGDCKDKATLLVAILQAAGLDAHIALLRVDEPADIDPALPGFGLFNQDAQRESKNLTVQPVYPVLSTTLTALLESAERAIVYSQTIYADAEARAADLSGAAATLLQLRQYEAANQLLKAAQRLTNNPATLQQAALFTKVKRYPDLLFPASDPRLPVQRLLVLVASSSGNLKDLDAILSKRANPAVWHDNLNNMRGHIAAFKAMPRSSGVSTDVICDMLLSTTKLETVGEGKPVYKINVFSQVNTGLSTVYVVQEDGQYRLLATNDGLTALGRSHSTHWQKAI